MLLLAPLDHERLDTNPMGFNHSSAIGPLSSKFD